MSPNAENVCLNFLHSKQNLGTKVHDEFYTNTYTLCVSHSLAN